MTATEARNLTRARRAETLVAYLLRTEIYPSIEWIAREGGTNDVIYPPCAPTVRALWRDTEGESVVPDLVARLREDGFEVVEISGEREGWRMSW